MYSLLLAVIYLAFISLGLPDSLLGSAWHVMHAQLGVPLSAMGFVTVVISGGTIVSSLLSDAVTRKFKTGPVVAASVLLTVAGLFGFSFSTKFWMLCLCAVPYGLGAGAIDAALNNYVALHYSSRHMSWLHCFWGVGTIVSPYIMSFALARSFGWGGGYRIVGYIQLGILAVLLCALPLWKKVAAMRTDECAPSPAQKVGVRAALKLGGVPFILLGFFAYCAAESTVMLWASSYLYQTKEISEEFAAALGSLFFIGITVGRFVSGFVSEKVGDKNMIRFGAAAAVVGVLLVGLSFSSLWVAVAGFLVIGLGCAPIYPSIIHATPANFGKENSQSVIGIQMASAYLGSTFMPPLFGLIANFVEIRLLPAYLALFFALTVVMTELLNARKKREK